MSSYLFGVNYGPDGVELDFFIDVSLMVGCHTPEDYNKMLDVRQRIDPEDQEVPRLRSLPTHLAYFLLMRPRFTSGGKAYKVDYEGGSLERDDFERYLRSLSSDDLRAWLKGAEV